MRKVRKNKNGVFFPCEEGERERERENKNLRRHKKESGITKTGQLEIGGGGEIELQQWPKQLFAQLKSS